ncbi:TonB-dependent receptor [Saccharicrinis aurantiacus]|uniref:TonB-dependent receptor n=1 Tax=Saccharicrinis aurantiacus TaxID=1849719 RepID=UPI00249164FF|nr:TonB-dependent receptor plug domain-containing protein [Saccharicrinis aurantiacus]
MRVCLLIAIIIGLKSIGVAQSKSDSITDVQIKEVEVSCKYQKPLTNLNAVSLKQEDIKAINTENFVNIVDRLPGITKIHEATFPVVIRGMYGSRIYIEKNGIVKRGTGRNGYTLEDIDPNNVSDIQLLHGARSIAFGSGSIGGVLLINEKTSYSKKGLHAKVGLSYANNNQEKASNLRLQHQSDQGVVSFGARVVRSDNFRYPNNVEALNSAYQYNNLNCKISRCFEEKKIFINWNNNFYNGERQKPLGFQNNPYDYRTFYDRYNFESVLNIDKTTRNNNRFSTNIWFNTLNTDQEQDQVNAGTKKVALTETRYQFKNSGGLKLKLLNQYNKVWCAEYGIDGNIEILSQDLQIRDIAHSTHNYYKDTLRQDRKIGGAYTVITYKKQKHQLGFSLRGDIGKLLKDQMHTGTYANISGGADWTVDVNKYWQNTLSLSRHFRFPDPMEAAGVHYGGRGVFVGNPDIQPELCYNFEWNLKLKFNHGNVVVNPWFSYFVNRINEVAIKQNKFTFENIEKSRVLGVDASLNLYTGKVSEAGQWNSASSFTIAAGDDISGTNILGEGTPLEGISPGRVRSKLEYRKNIHNKLANIYTEYTYVLPYNRLPPYAVKKTWGQNERDAYALLDAGVSYNFGLLKSNVCVVFTVNNILDTEYQAFGSYLYGVGRNYKVHLAFTI